MKQQSLIVIWTNLRAQMLIPIKVHDRKDKQKSNTIALLRSRDVDTKILNFYWTEQEELKWTARVVSDGPRWIDADDKNKNKY